MLVVTIPAIRVTVRRTYRVVLLDPPWPEKGGGRVKRGADRHYKLMSPKAIRSTVLEAEAFKRVGTTAHMYMWVTNTYLESGLWLMKELGFTYKTNFVWVKRRMGIGQYARGKHELLLFGTRGRGYDVRTPSRRIHSVIDADHGRDASGKIIHSRKPVEAHELVEARSYGPYLEMFARERRMGWHCWGDELGAETDECDSDSSRGDGRQRGDLVLGGVRPRDVHSQVRVLERPWLHAVVHDGRQRSAVA